MVKILKYLVLLLLFLYSFTGSTAEIVWKEASQLSLDEYMEFTVSDGVTLVGDEKWYQQAEELSRSQQQYLHFRVSIANPQDIDQSLWLVSPFPAIKYLTVTDGHST